MEEKINLKVFTKRNKILDEEVEAVFIPGYTGELGILPGHRPLIALLGIGILTYLKEGKEYFIGIDGGIVEVIQRDVKVLVDEIIERDKIVEEEELKKLSEAEESLKTLSGEELEEAKKKIKRARVSLKLLKI